MKVVSDRFATETALSTNAAAKKAIEALAAAVKEEDRCLVISQKSLITDDKRDNIFRGLRKSIKGLTDAPVADVAQAAKELTQRIKDIRVRRSLQLEGETALLMKLTEECETTYAEQVKRLGVGGLRDGDQGSQPAGVQPDQRTDAEPTTAQRGGGGRSAKAVRRGLPMARGGGQRDARVAR